MRNAEGCGRKAATSPSGNSGRGDWFRQFLRSGFTLKEWRPRSTTVGTLHHQPTPRKRQLWRCTYSEPRANSILGNPLQPLRMLEVVSDVSSRATTTVSAALRDRAALAAIVVCQLRVSNRCSWTRTQARSVETRSSARKWVGILGNGALHVGARSIVRASWILN